ncbi:MAG: hypothetical protein P8Y97_19295 [Candidatus Lokiarchaeota archaeon]
MDELDEQIDKFVRYFKRKTNLDRYNLEEIDKILTSDKYSEFIDSIYKYYNNKAENPPNYDGRLSIQHYMEVDHVINTFWDLLLGEHMNEKYRMHLKTKLNI